MPCRLAVLLAAIALHQATADDPKPKEAVKSAGAPASKRAARPELAAAPAPKQDFKIVVGLYSADPRAIGAAELIHHGGRMIQITGDSEELIVFDPQGARVELLDLRDKRRTQITYARLDDDIEKYKLVLKTKADGLARRPGRSNRVQAGMTRCLIEPTWLEAFDAQAGRMSLKTDYVEVDAAGERDDDPVRLAFLGQSFLVLTKLGAVRNPDLTPPFTRLDTLDRLTRVHKLRPTETSFIYRLAGPPTKYRWTYQYTPKLDEQDLAIFEKVEEFRTSARLVSFEEYERGRN